MSTLLQLLADVGTCFGGFTLGGKFLVAFCAAWTVASIGLLALLWLSAITGAGRGSDEAEDEAKATRRHGPLR